jgi:hypothetical protein
MRDRCVGQAACTCAVPTEPDAGPAARARRHSSAQRTILVFVGFSGSPHSHSRCSSSAQALRRRSAVAVADDVVGIPLERNTRRCRPIIHRRRGARTGWPVGLITPPATLPSRDAGSCLAAARPALATGARCTAPPPQSRSRRAAFVCSTGPGWQRAPGCPRPARSRAVAVLARPPHGVVCRATRSVPRPVRVLVEQRLQPPLDDRLRNSICRRGDRQRPRLAIGLPYLHALDRLGHVVPRTHSALQPRQVASQVTPSSARNHRRSAA